MKPSVGLRGRMGIGILAAATVLISACQASGDPTSGSSASMVESSVDVAALDTGAYPTEPAKPFGYADPEQLVDVEAQRMAEFVVLPFQIDESLDLGTSPTTPIRSDRELQTVFGRAAEAAKAGAVYGFSTSAKSSAATDTGRGITIAAVRYKTADAAKKSAADLSEAVSKDAPVGVVKKRDPIATKSGAFSVVSAVSGDIAAAAFVPHGQYLVYAQSVARSNDTDWAVDTALKATTSQSSMIDKFPATPTPDENPDDNTRKVKLDQNNILIYALPLADTSDGIAAVYGPQGIAHFTTHQRETYANAAKFGSVHTAVAKSFVYRASTSDNGAKLRDALVAVWTDNGARPVESPAGLSSAKCAKSGTKESLYNCAVRVGRYVGLVAGDSLADAQQQASAQYVILTKADQDAN